jgi:hypothetical protein
MAVRKYPRMVLTAHFLLVTFQRRHLLHDSDVKDLDRRIPRGGGYEVTVWIPLGGLNRVLVLLAARQDQSQ